MRRHWAAFTVLTLTASPAFAQYVATTDVAQFPALFGGTTIALQAPAMADPADRGRADVALGFTFPYYNRQYTSVTVTANGMLFLEPSTAMNLTSDFGFNVAMPSVSEPRAIIAPFWDDLWGKNATSRVQRQAVVDPINGNGMAIEWTNWSEAFGMYDLNFQVRLWENGLIDFHYGQMSGNGGTPSATCGISNPTGTLATQCKVCTQSDGGVNQAACGVSDFGFPGQGAETRIRFQPPPQPDLSINRLQVDSVVPSGPNLQISTTLFLRNFGGAATGPFSYRLYLSADTIFDVGDVPFDINPVAMASIPSLGSAQHMVTGLAPRPMTGTYYVLVRVDSENVVMESNELNNVAVNGVPLQNGVDLVAQDITGPPLGGPGDMVTNIVTFSNQGLDPAGMVRLQILLSLDNAYDPGVDRIVYDGTMNVAGGQNISQPITYTLSGLVPANDYYFILVLDPAPGTVTELLENNNVKVATSRFTAMQADLIIEQVRVQRTVAPFNPATVAFFGEQIRLEAVVKNQGGASAPNVTVAFYLSDNETLNGITDPFIAQDSVTNLGPGQSQTVTLTMATVPTRAVDNSPLAPGPYFFFAAAVGVMLNETTTTNNFLKSPPTLVRGPAPDLLATLIAGPQRIGAGEQMRVSRTLANFGNRPAAGVRYRYYLSANTIVTSGDVQLKIKDDAGMLVDEQILPTGLAPNATDTATETVEVPSTVQPATYFLGVLVDPEATVDEVTRDNNGLAGAAIEVVGPGLRIDTLTVPDAVVDRPYAIQLHGGGGDGNYTWSLPPGSTPPPGLTLSAAGMLAGTPTQEGAYPLSLRVSSGGDVTDGVLVVRVVRPTSSIFIRTVDLPSPGRMVDYLAVLSAGGGRAPYTWVLDSGVMPQGLSLALDGTISGQAVQALGTSFDFVIRVRDSVGNTETKPFRMVIVDGSALIIQTYSLKVATVGSQYLTDIIARNGAPPLTWTLAYGALPEGLELQRQDDKLLITGTPLVAGVFPFTIEVVDARGRSDTTELVLEVQAPSIQVKIAGELPDRVLRGQDVDVQFTIVGPAPGTLKWVVRDGALPPGLALEESGRLTGQVAGDAEFGVYAFSVGPTVEGQLITFASYSVEVVERLSTGRRCGCSGAEGFALFALGALLLRRRKRGQATFSDADRGR